VGRRDKGLTVNKGLGYTLCQRVGRREKGLTVNKGLGYTLCQRVGRCEKGVFNTLCQRGDYIVHSSSVNKFRKLVRYRHDMMMII
jgi:hypothetical protein